MRRFLNKAILFSIIILILSIALDRMICRGLLSMEDYRFQDYAAMLDGGMNNEVLILGNSRGKSHFDPFIIDSICQTNSYCIGIGGYPINVQRAKYNLYKEHNDKPRILVLNVDHMTLSLFNDVRHQHQSEQFFPLVYDSVMRKELKNLGYGFAELNIPLYRMLGYQQVIKNGLLEALHLKHYVSRPAYKGHRPEEGVWNGSELDNMAVHDVEIPDEARVFFESFLEECHKDSVNVVLVNSPMYEGAKEKLLGLDAIQRYFKEVASRFGYHYLDYTDDEICRDTSNFCVSVHMNPEATKAFSKEFSEELSRIMDGKSCTRLGNEKSIPPLTRSNAL